MAEWKGIFALNDPYGMSQEKERSIHGKHPVLEAIDAGKSIDRVLVRKKGGKGVEEVMEAARTRGIPFQKVPSVKLDKIVKGNHQGIVALMTPVSFADPDELLATAFDQGRDPLFLLLDGVTDVRNFGAVCRTAECCGVDALFVPARGSARINDDAVRTSAGALMRIPVARCFQLHTLPPRLADHGVPTVACTEKDAMPIEDVDLRGPLAVVMGDEEKGVSEAVLKGVRQKIRLPLKGAIDSLNVSVASGMILYEILRQRKG
ncbi:MAG: 23S rRNA (guanosine(2251)-2'-O)-methyltransferase RlmB [Flavobacteriales bacterium]